jgi:hypothetical protein
MSLDFIKPQLASPVDHPPPRAGSIHEVKHDGYRTLLIVERRRAMGLPLRGSPVFETLSVSLGPGLLSQRLPELENQNRAADP